MDKRHTSFPGVKKRKFEQTYSYTPPANQAPKMDNPLTLQEAKDLKPAIAVQDDDCHWYVIPADLYDEWTRLNEEMDSDGQATFEAAQDKFIDLFNKYRTGGDLNNVQLYAEFKP